MRYATVLRLCHILWTISLWTKDNINSCFTLFRSLPKQSSIQVYWHSDHTNRHTPIQYLTTEMFQQFKPLKTFFRAWVNFSLILLPLLHRSKLLLFCAFLQHLLSVLLCSLWLCFQCYFGSTKASTCIRVCSFERKCLILRKIGGVNDAQLVCHAQHYKCVCILVPQLKIFCLRTYLRGFAQFKISSRLFLSIFNSALFFFLIWKLVV